MARCTGCGNELNAAARFCPLCGAQAAGQGAAAPPNQTQPVTPPSGATLRTPAVTPSYGGPSSPPDTAGKGKVYAAAGVGGVLVLIAALLLAKASGLLAANKTDVPKTAVLNAPTATAPTPAPLLNAPRVNAPSVPSVSAPVLQAPTQAGVPMPDDVIDYLRWLKKYETARQQLKARSESQMVLIMGNMIKAPLQELMKEPDEQGKNTTIAPISKEDFANLSKISQEWNQAASIFQQKRPPNACAPLAASYNNMLTTVIQQEIQLQQLLETSLRQITQNNGNATPDIQQTLQKLYGERNNGAMSKQADATFSSASGALDALRSRYTSMPDDINKANFTIQDESNVTVPNAPMMPGMGF
jgi:hypothetical protein